MKRAFLLLCAAVIPGLLFGAERVALVVGNDKYANLPANMQLTSPVADARDVAAALKALGYTLITGSALTDASRDTLADATEAFAEAARGADAAVFYYSGHGVQVGEDNYLLPSDAPRLTGMSVLKNRAILLRDSVMVALEEAGAKNKVIILDCCRDNPFAAQLDAALAQVGKSIKTKSVGEITGYGPGFYLAFATSPGTLANDGNGRRNSPFTEAMLKSLPAGAGKDIDFFFRDVKVKLGGSQVSWTNHSLTESFALGRATPGALTPVVPGDPVKSARRERPFVNSLGLEFIPVPGKPHVLMCRTETRVRDFRAFAKDAKYTTPGGIFASTVTGDAKSGYSFSTKLNTALSWENPGFPQADDHPVAGMCWHDANEFALWLSRKEKRKYRVPTDEEWSAAVGTGKYPWGSVWPVPEGTANYKGSEWLAGAPKASWTTAYTYNDGYARTAPVASFPENRHGFFDLGGNLTEVCEDRYRADMNSSEVIALLPTLKDEKDSDGTEYRVYRGASWSDFKQEFMTSSFRLNRHPLARTDFVGFRCVLEVPAN